MSAAIPDRAVDGAAVEGEQRELQKVMNEIIVGGHYWGCSVCAALGSKVVVTMATWVKVHDGQLCVTGYRITN